MTSELIHLGTDDISSRKLLLLTTETSKDLPTKIDASSRYFVALLVWDASTTDASEIARVARLLLDAGCVYFCCWGPGCEKVHDIIDEEYVGDGSNINTDQTIMTTWHNDDSLEEATWFALNLAFPDDCFFDNCNAIVSICISDQTWKAELEKALMDPKALTQRVVPEGDSPK